MSTPSLTDFLLARIAEDEADAESIKDFAGAEGYYGTKTLAECEAKRRIVAALPADPGGVGEKYDYDGNAWAVLCALALPYADHDDYDESWRP